MSEFCNEIDLRVREAYESLTQAQAEHDDFLADLRIGELRVLSDLAEQNGHHIAVPPEVLA